METAPADLPEPPAFHPPRPERLDLSLPAKPWIVLRKGDPAPAIVYAMTPATYALFSLDLARITKWIGDANAVIDFYERNKPTTKDGTPE